jgi:hypothetical protein
MEADRSIYGTMAMILGVVCAGGLWWCCGGTLVPERAAPTRDTPAQVRGQGGADQGVVDQGAVDQSAAGEK